MTRIELPDEQAELDFVLGQFPVRMRQAREGEEFGRLPAASREDNCGAHHGARRIRRHRR